MLKRITTRIMERVESLTRRSSFLNLVARRRLNQKIVKRKKKQ